MTASASPPVKELRVALVMGGGVSLGSFSSGALAELCRLLERLNHQTRQPVCIDVATGASAGAMTLAVLFRYLYAGARVSTIRAAMRDCWVEGVGIDCTSLDKQLLPQLNRHRSASLLSDRPLRRLGQRHVLEYAGEDQGCGLLAKTAYLSFSLTNLNGLEQRAPCHWSSHAGCPVEPKQPGDDALTTTQYEDRIRFRLERNATSEVLPRVDPSDAARPIGDLDPERWRSVMEAAQASGAFPGAFAPRSIRRYREEYGSRWPTTIAGDSHVFSYIDGGMLMNEPLKEALTLANYVDQGDDPNSYERVFFFVDPVVSGSGSRLVLANEVPKDWSSTYDPRKDEHRYEFRRASYVDEIRSDLSRVSDALFGQATFRDWLNLGKTNRRVEWLDELMEVLVPHLHDLQLPVQAAQGLEDLVARMQAQRFGLTTQSEKGESAASNSMPMDRESERRQGVLRSEIAKRAPQASSAQHKLAAQLQLALEHIAGLEQKRDVNVIAVSPHSVDHASVRLAGNFAGAFGGFFKQEWREHDFEVGQDVMRHTLAHNSLAQSLLGLARVMTAHEAQWQVRECPSSGYEQVDPQVRQWMESVLHEHLEEFLHGAGVPHFVDHLLAWKLKRALLRRLRQPGPEGVARLALRIAGPALGELDRLMSQDGEHSVPPFGKPLRIVASLETLFDPKAGKGSEPYRMHGPQLFRDQAQPYLKLQTRRGETLQIILEGTAEQWHQRAQVDPWIDVVMQGAGVLRLNPGQAGEAKPGTVLRSS